MYGNILIPLFFAFFTISNATNYFCRENFIRKNEDYFYLEDNFNYCDNKGEDSFVINGYLNNEIIEEKPFSSGCVKCLLCLTIANEFNKLFLKFHVEYPPKKIKREAVIKGTLKRFCDKEFLDFDYREDIKTHSRVLEKPTENTIHVSSKEDGLWSLQLRELCHSYLSVHGEFGLYKRWFEHSQIFGCGMVDLLCRSYGLFKHCRNLPIRIPTNKVYLYID